MKKYAHMPFRCAFGLAAAVWFSLPLGGCIDLLGSRQAQQAERKAHAPYYGTGIIVSVIGTNLVGLTFRSGSLPATMASLIVVRSNSIIGRVEFGVGRSDSKHLCKIIQGSPVVGDLALGWQREAEFAPPSPWRKLP
jgi:hypothetical protein